MAGFVAVPRQDRAALGMGMMLAAWSLFSVVDTSVKWLVALGLPALQLAFVRYAVAAALSVAMGARGGLGLTRVTRAQLWLLLVRAGLLISATVLNFVALRFLPLTITASVMFAAPFIVCALSGPLLGERVGPWRWAAIALGFAGVLVVIQPFGASFHWATLLCVYTATALALFSILTRRLAGEVHSQTMQLYMGVMGTVLLFPTAVWTWTSPETLRDWILLAAIGGCAWAGHELFGRAHSFAEASFLTPFQYSFLLFMSLASFLVFGEVPTWTTLAGAVLIVAAGLIIWARESSREPKDV